MPKKVWINNPPICEVCGWKIRPARSSEDVFPGTAPYGGKGLCNRCYRKKKYNGRNKPEPKPVRQYPTVRELWEQGHPCIEPCPLPATKRTLPF